ncbi:MAG TPA: ComEA family DNA-binding protein [Candidatus Lumbricidophila sp.]|nr:ComEA family DNA-binding protein [Candidatus Lumbricidophila sp.]
MTSPDDPFAAVGSVSRRSSTGARIATGGAVVLFIGAVGVAGVIAWGSSSAGSVEVGPGGAGASSAPAIAHTAPRLLVHVLGEVVRPGLVELAPGARVVDAIAAAGGFTQAAHRGTMNLARPVADGEQLNVLAVGAAPAAAGGGGGASDGLVHLNSAGLADLDTLPRIGPTIAQRILDWREKHGPFTSIDQLREIPGIGDALFAGVVDRVAL